MINCYQAPGTQKVLQKLFPPFPLLFLLSSLFPHNKQAAWLLTYRRDRRAKAASWPLGPWEGGGGHRLSYRLPAGACQPRAAQSLSRLHFPPALDPVGHGRNQMRTKEVLSPSHSAWKGSCIPGSTEKSRRQYLLLKSHWGRLGGSVGEASDSWFQLRS